MIRLHTLLLVFPYFIFQKHYMFRRSSAIIRRTTSTTTTTTTAVFVCFILSCVYEIKEPKTNKYAVFRGYLLRHREGIEVWLYFLFNLVTRHARPLYPQELQIPAVWEAGWASGQVWTGAKNLTPNGIQPPERPTRGEYKKDLIVFLLHVVTLPAHCQGRSSNYKIKRVMTDNVCISGHLKFLFSDLMYFRFWWCRCAASRLL